MAKTINEAREWLKNTDYDGLCDVDGRFAYETISMLLEQYDGTLHLAGRISAARDNFVARAEYAEQNCLQLKDDIRYLLNLVDPKHHEDLLRVGAIRSRVK